MSANQLNVLEDGTSVPDLLAALDEACDADEQQYEDLLVQYGLEVVDPLPADPAEGGSLLLAAPDGPAGGDGAEPFTHEEWVLWLASGADEQVYRDRLAVYE